MWFIRTLASSIVFISNCSQKNSGCELKIKTHQDMDKMLFANLDKYFEVTEQTDKDFNEIQKSAKVARTDILDGIVAKCKKVSDA